MMARSVEGPLVVVETNMALSVSTAWVLNERVAVVRSKCG
jgi:phosphatidylserine decarboxylase